MCIEYGIKKLYLQEYDEIEQVGVYCEEVIVQKRKME